MKLTALDELLWAAGFLSSAVLILILIWRARWRQFPLLTMWNAFVAGKSILCYLVYRSSGLGHLYARVYWGSLWLDFALQVGTAVELARVALRRNGAWVGDSLKLFLFAAGCGVVAFALLSAWIVPPHGIYTAWELREDLFVSLVICELLASVSLIANWLRLAWERHALAIAEGLTAWIAVSLVVNALQSYLGARYFEEIEYFQSYAWIGATVWIAMEFAFPTSETESSALEPPTESPPTHGLPPGMIRPIAGALTGFRKLRPPAATPSHGISPPLPAEHSFDGVQT